MLREFFLLTKNGREKKEDNLEKETKNSLVTLPYDKRENKLKNVLAHRIELTSILVLVV